MRKSDRMVCISLGNFTTTRPDISSPAKLAISIARKMNALIFLVPEDIVDVRAKLVCPHSCLRKPLILTYVLDSHLCGQSHESASLGLDISNSGIPSVCVGNNILHVILAERLLQFHLRNEHLQGGQVKIQQM